MANDGYYNPELHVAPVYENEDWRGLVHMEVLNGSITPLPEESGSPQVRPNLLSYGAGYVYQGRTTYHFTADLVPEYVFQNEQKTKLCVYNQRFRYQPQSRAAWKALLANRSPTRYEAYIDNTGFNGEIEDFYDQGTLYLSFVVEGAQDCGVQPTSRF